MNQSTKPSAAAQGQTRGQEQAQKQGETQVANAPRPPSPKFGTLYLIPTNLSEPFSAASILPAEVVAITCRLDHFIAENAKSTRAFLRGIGMPRRLVEISIVELDKHHLAQEPSALLAPLLAGHDVGLVSEAGAPAVADPGSLIVAAAHRAGIAVRPLVGPSSILLALMSSGLNGQAFAFHGYLPQDKPARSQSILALERESREKRITQMFIETPYRNQAMLQELLASLSATTTLCVATDLTGNHERIVSQKISQWRSSGTGVEKMPAMFLFLA